jgi:hypothetical protein
MPSFKVVFVPQAASRPIEEREVEYTEETKVSCLMDMAREHFRGVLPKDAEKNRQVYEEQVRKQAEAKGFKMPDGDPNGLMTQLADVQMVDTVAVQLNHPQEDNVAVTLYVDDRAVAKGVEMNERATQFSIAAGWRQGILGDAFVARARDDNDDLFERLDFTVAELSSDAPWMAGARRLNAKRTQPSDDPSSGGATVHRPQEQQAESEYARLSTLERLEFAARRREEGNDHFKSGHVDAAAEAYQEALVLFEMVARQLPAAAPAAGEAAAAAKDSADSAAGAQQVVVAETTTAAAAPANGSAAGQVQEARVAVHNNMALVRAKQERWEDSAIHASRALALDPDNVKALFRRGGCVSRWR